MSITTPTPAAPAVPLRRNRDFQILWSGRAVSALGSQVTEIAYPLLMLAITGSAGYAGMLGASQLITSLIVSLPAGLLADRMNRRTIMIVADLGRAVLLGGLALAVFTGHTSIPLIIATAIGSAAFGALFNPASGAAIKALVTPAQMKQAQAQNQARMHGAQLLGPPVGGWLLGLGRSVPFLVDAITYVLGAIALLFIRRPLQDERDDRRPLRFKDMFAFKDMAAGLKFVFADRIIRAVMSWGMGVNLAYSGFFLILIATWHARGASEASIGLLSALATAGGLLGALLTGPITRAVKPATLVRSLAWVLPVLTAVMAFLPGVIPIAVAFMLAMLLLPALNTVMLAFIAERVPDELQGRANAGTNVLAQALQPIGPLLLGTIFDAWGTPWAFGTAAALLAVAALFTFSRHITALNHL
ncbi:hypothetical protein Afil01_03510 [Actinorhabdospora filicis]|uniref:Major facilitator superfamily (MFS) profile domain-containing protein n=1 Tax=Actinorhabdospora filicis TaxID=1785913 RepID=A0A9W6W6G7_9ACTN|nr:MFS transporter [Actinorhabdospora filicis]GLZ75544.1 hypothetical protein Afil01_03510 [Actinorhabdospora filicis]